VQIVGAYHGLFGMRPALAVPRPAVGGSAGRLAARVRRALSQRAATSAGKDGAGLMPDVDIWGQDDRTDRAIELLTRGQAAKRDADGRIVPRHRYSRHFSHVAGFLIDQAWGSLSETVTMSKRRDESSRRTTVTVTIEVRMPDGTSWVQEGVTTSGEDSFDWYGLAACRALLHYVDDGGEPMAPDAVIEMLEDQALKAWRLLESPPPSVQAEASPDTIDTVC
jgi:hypothetical protein